MNTPGLFSFPLPMLTALLCGVIAVVVWRLDLGPRRASVLLSLVFALGAVLAFLVGLRFGYANTALLPLQRVLPLFLGPLIYLGFLSLLIEGARLRTAIAAHLTAPLAVFFTFFLLLSERQFLDWVIGASYIFYIVALLALWRKGPDALIFARVDVAPVVSNWILRAAGLLVFLVVLDSVIALDFALNQGANVSKLISFGTIPLVLGLLLILATLPRMMQRARASVKPQSQDGDAQDSSVEAKLSDLLREDRLFLEPDLTVQRLAKRLHMPARSVSGAINRTKDMNVSQYVNTFRLAHAAELLSSGSQSVKSVAEASGFLTRSNFYREFQRVYEMSPTEYRNAARPK